MKYIDGGSSIIIFLAGSGLVLWFDIISLAIFKLIDVVFY